MSSSADVRDFLTSRRARITPDRVGLTASPGRRRVTGLRREEVAMLAGVSVDYYVRLERGNLTGVSDVVLAAVSRALLLDRAEQKYLADLAAGANRRPSAGRPSPRRRTDAVRPPIQRLIDATTSLPVQVVNECLEIVAANRLCRALYAPLQPDASGRGRPVNLARSTFLDDRARTFFRDWDRVAEDTAALLRAAVGRSPDDVRLAALVRELNRRSTHFAGLWASHDVTLSCTRHKRIRHPQVGDLDLDVETLAIVGDEGLVVLAFVGEPGSPTERALGALIDRTPFSRTSSDRTSSHRPTSPRALEGGAARCAAGSR